MKFCKICKKEIAQYRIYCSNTCKFSDIELNKKRSSKKEKSENRIRHKRTGKIFNDVHNHSGTLTRYSKNILNESFNETDWEIIDPINYDLWKCPKCEWTSRDTENKSGVITAHLKNTHGINKDTFIKQYPEYSRIFSNSNSNNNSKKNGKKKTKKIEKTKEKIYIRNIKTVACKICNGTYSIVGFATHLKSRHQTTPDEYANKYEEYRPIKINNTNKIKNSKENIECRICNERMVSRRKLAFHIRIVHGMSTEEYILQYFLNSIVPTCKCGCGNNVRIYSKPPYHAEYISGHNPNGMQGKNHSKESRNKMSKKAIERADDTIKKNTKIEKKFVEFLINNNIKFEFQKRHELGIYDFYLTDLDLYVEIDGIYWHPEKLVNLEKRQIEGTTSTHRKSRIDNLIRIRGSAVDSIDCIEDLYEYNFTYDYNIGYRDKIVKREKFINSDEKYLKLFANSLFVFYKEVLYKFPTIETKESLCDVMSILFNDKFILTSDEFSNNISNVGVDYLKSIFFSYWKSKYRGNKYSPVEAWQDEKIMRKVIEYRIGINPKRETYDFSLRNLIRGLSAYRYTISFFKPLLASRIYFNFLRGAEMPIVLDPCSGFGGRMLGFCAKYKHGTYIGVEYNTETFTELCNLRTQIIDNGFGGEIILYNDKFENVFEYITGIYSVDLTFTSIPYYDKEIYSNNPEYKNYVDWKNKFLNTVLQCNNLILNIDTDLEKDCEGYKNKYTIRNNTSHFNVKENTKVELLLKYF